MKGKYKKIYWIVIVAFVAINLAAVLFVFKKYRAESQKSLQVSKIKFKFSKVKEKITELETKANQGDSFLWTDLANIIKDKNVLDSLLIVNNIQDISLSSINEKLQELNIKSSDLEKSVESTSSNVKTDS